MRIKTVLKKTLVLAVASFLTFGLAGCGDAQSNQLNDLAAVAKKKGYLEEELNKVGFTLQVTGFQGQGPEINAALMSGSLDAGNYSGKTPTKQKDCAALVGVLGLMYDKI